MKSNKLFIVIFIFTSLIIYPQSDTIRFAWMSDTHIGNPTAAEDLRNSVRDINSIAGINFIIISGDVTQMGSNEELKLAKQILDSLKQPYHIIPGNHDCKWSESGAQAFMKLWGNDRFVFEFDDYLFLGLHQGPRIRMGDGHWAPEDLRWLDSTLNKISHDKRIFFVTHYPINEEIDNWYEVLDRMKKINTQAFLFGHGHANRIMNFEGVPGVMGRSNLRASKPVGGYTIAEIVDDTIKFFEKTPLTDSMKYWHHVVLGEKEYDESGKEKRPGYSVNLDYPKVEQEWVFASGFTNASSPLAWKDYVYTADASGSLTALSKKNGKAVFKFSTNGAVFSTPDFSDGSIVFGSTDNNIYCIDAESGELNWKLQTGAEVIGSPAIENGVVYIGGSDRKFKAIDLKSGNVIWEFDQLDGFVETKPLLHEDKIIFGAWDEHLYCLDKDTGNLLWKWKGDVEGVLYSPAACIPVAANNKVFIAAPDRKLTAIDIKTGKQLWRTGKYQVRESIGISEDGSKLFVRTMRDSIIAFPTNQPDESIPPSPIWIVNAGFGYDINSAQLVEKDGTLFYGTKNGLLLSLDSGSGEILWKHKTGVTIINTVTPIDSSSVLVNDFDGRTMLIKYKE